MKKLMIIILISSLPIFVKSQISIPPSKGDRYNYFLNGDVWETDINYESKFALKVFVSTKGIKNIWIQNLSLREDELIKLMDYIDSLNSICIGGETKSAPAGTDNYKLDSFEIYYCDYSDNVTYQDTDKIDLFELRNNIRKYFTK